MKRLVLIVVLMSSSCFAQTRMFPAGALDTRNDLDVFRNQWYSRALQALHEPSLSSEAKDQRVESYRFLWLRSFNHPVSVRIYRNDKKQWMLTLKIASGAGGYPPGVLIDEETCGVKDVDMQAFLTRVNKTGFWTAPNPVNDQKGTDGSQWIIEGVKDGKYHVVDRWYPKDGVARELGWEMVFNLAGLEVPKQSIY
ncbi:hypothetical protein [Silvibacterium dinghuense]|uniref:Uncharacterized protein n=1 Tax=Silvibacterium dinghuense TaxID=1560006 RepID=A0A4Q1SK53_9BACT|nr:hypothetical protein [Silvibacterium dinghuense]RXS97837.1 hypothetical protein ESZ00_08245 [Silvibacterium dinghuense]GGH02325.1 hypothetical protein GCM10011586_17690 [Silvibacterium dinghuense]